MIRSILLLIILTFSISLSYVNDTTKYSPTEILIINRIANGKVADLNYNYTNEGNVIHVDFLEELINNRIKGLNIPPIGIFIKNAVFIQELNLSNIEIPHSIRLENCEFQEKVHFYNTHFKKDFSLVGSSFLKLANFNSMQVEHSFHITKAKFYDEINLVNCLIRSQMQANNVEFTNENSIINFEGLEIGRSGLFLGSKFRGRTSFKNVIVGKNLEMNNSTFESYTDFQGMTVRGSVFLNGSEFSERTNFGTATVEIEFHSENCIYYKEAIFNAANFNRAYFTNSTFKNSADFREFETKGILKFENANFLSNDDIINFRGMSIGSTASFVSSEFHSQVDFGYASIEGTLSFNKCKFLNRVNFNSVTVGLNLTLNEVKFYKSAKFIGAIVSKQIQIRKASFNSGAIFNGVMANGIIISGTKFLSEADFSFIKIAYSLEIDSTDFVDSSSVLSLNGANIAHLIFFSNSKTNSTIDFAGCYVGGEITIENSTFDYHGSSIRTKKLKVEKSINIFNCTFNSDIDIEECQVNGYIKIDSTVIKGNLNFETVAVTYSVSVRNSNIAKSYFISNLVSSNVSICYNEIGNELVFANSKITNRINLHENNHKRLRLLYINLDGLLSLKSNFDTRYIEFTECQVGSVIFNIVSWSERKDSILLGGLNYRTISTGNQSIYTSMIEILAKSKFNLNAYTNFENFLRRSGENKLANNVYVLKKKREGNESDDLLGYIGNQVLFITIGYGKNPLFLILWCGFFIVIGMVYFPLDKMEEISEPSRLPKYNRFWYSVDLFLPLISLGFSNNWQPKQDGKIRHIYAHIHKLLGWGAITIVIGSLTGLIG